MSTNRVVTATLSRIRSASSAAWVLGLMCVLHALYFSWLQVDLHNGLGTFSYDVGLYDQGLWLLSRGEAPFVTLMGRNLFGDHASFILVFLIPLYWVIPGTATLLVVQAIAISAAAIPIYLFARHALRNSSLALLFAFIWLVNPAVNGTNMENFHPDGFLGLFVALALYAALTSRWRLYAISLALCLLVKEDLILLVFPLGVYLFAVVDRRKGLWTVLATMVMTYVGMFVVMRSLIGVPTRNTWRIPFGGLTGLVSEMFMRPWNVIRYLTQNDRPTYIFQMAAPLAGAFVLSPFLAAVAVPVLASNVLSTFWYQHSIQYHYSLVVMPVLIFASIAGVKKCQDSNRAWVTGAIAMCSLGSFIAWGQTPLSLYPRQVLPGDNVVAVTGREIIRSIPDDAVVSVYDPLSTHLAHRKEVYFFPNPFKALYYGVDDSLTGTRLPAADRVEYVVLPKVMSPEVDWEWRMVAPDFTLIEENTYWNIFRRRSP